MERIIRPVREDEYDDAMELAWQVFQLFNAPEYTEEGAVKFRQFLKDEIIHKLFYAGEYRIFGFFVDDVIEGMISLRNKNHISLLFVDRDYQNEGVGFRLLTYLSQYCLEWEEQSCITVNSSPYAVGFYHKFGFCDTDVPQFVDGISYTPMKYML